MNSLIKDIDVFPEKQNVGYGTKLLQYAIDKHTDIPTLNNVNAEGFYRRMGLAETGRQNRLQADLMRLDLH